MEKSGAESRLHVLQGAGHGGPQFSHPDTEAMILSFFDQHLKKGSTAAADSALVPLFDGKTLDGWTIEGGSATYRVEDGVIVGKTTEGSPNTFLCTKKTYGDFELQVELKCDPRLNSGIQIRSHTYKKDTPQASRPERIRVAGTVYGPQCEVAAAESGVSGNFWDEARHTKWLDDFSDRPAARKAFRNNQWNRYRIVARGDRIRSWVNGVPCADFRHTEDKTGFIGLQVHGIRAGDGPYEVRWRNVRIREF